MFEGFLMTTQPSNMKPSDRIRELAGKNGGSVIHATVQYLDERHAAGQGEPAHTCQLAQSTTGADCPRCKVLGIDGFTVDPVAAPPAQPAVAYHCFTCPREVPEPMVCDECYKRDNPEAPAQPALQPGERWEESQAYREQQMDKVVANIEKQMDPVRAAVAADYERAQYIKAQRAEAQPVAAEPAVPVAGELDDYEVVWRALEFAMAEGIGGGPGWTNAGHAGNGFDVALAAAERLNDSRNAALAQVEQLIKRVAELEPAAGEPIWSRHNLLHELRERKVETTGLRKDLAAANERAARLEAERAHLLEGCRLMLASHELGLVRDTAYGAALDRWIYAERARLGTEPPPVATGERPIVVGSTWQEKDTGRLFQVESFDIDSGRVVSVDKESGARFGSYRGTFYGLHTWLSDPPTPATGGEGELKQQWRVVSRDRDGDDEWEVDDHGPYTEEAALKRAETWNIGSNHRRFKAQRIPATSSAVPDSSTGGES